MRFAHAIVAILILSVAGVALADNLLANPGFETGDTSGWEIHGMGGDSSIFAQFGDNGPLFPGDYNAFMSNEGEAHALLLKQSTAIGDAIAGAVNYSFDLKLDLADVGGVFFVNMFAEQSGVGIIGGSGLQGPFWPWNAWQTFSGSWVAPAGTDFLTIQMECVTGADTESNCMMHVDNVIMDQDTVAAEELSFSGVKNLFR